MNINLGGKKEEFIDSLKDILDKLPASYSAEVYEKKYLEVYQHIYENYSERDMSIYQILKLI